MATILTFAAGCDKASGGALPLLSGRSASAGADAEPPASAQLDISSHPDVLFEVFGARDDARMIPVAVLGGGAAGAAGDSASAIGLRTIVLSSAKWRVFDAYYHRVGAKVTAYRDGHPAGQIDVQRGMWAADAPLYSLPGCRRLTPLASVTPPSDTTGDYTVDYLASTSSTLGASSRAAAVAPMERADAARIGRRVGEAVAKEHFIAKEVLESLDFRAFAVPTGTSKQATVVASYLAPPSLHSESDKSDAQVSHVFALADARPDGYAVTYRHAVNGPAADAEYRRYLDHLDLDGDGVDEIVLQGWRRAGDTFLEVLAFRGGQWTPVYRGRESWCLDEKGR
ncbi:MAG TPA: hypothetical protein VFJ74_17320 [Gemmatimonadaceae bacterium]|nr:hypothetical protein [Gemmatimonadaceae bacterium]